MEQLNAYYKNQETFLKENGFADPVFRKKTQNKHIKKPEDNLNDDYENGFALIGGIIMGTKAGGVNTTFLHYRLYYGKERKWVVGGRYTYDQLKRLRVNPNIHVFDLEGYYLKIGFQAMYPLWSNFYFYSPIQFPLGYEKYYSGYGWANDMTINYIFGVSVGQGICYVSKSLFGVYIGAHLYEMACSSVVYKYDVGVCAELGFKF